VVEVVLLSAESTVADFGVGPWQELIFERLRCQFAVHGDDAKEEFDFIRVDVCTVAGEELVEVVHLDLVSIALDNGFK